MPEIEKLTQNDPETQSADIVAGNVAALQALFRFRRKHGKPVKVKTQGNGLAFKTRRPWIDAQGQHVVADLGPPLRLRPEGLDVIDLGACADEAAIAITLAAELHVFRAHTEDDRRTRDRWRLEVITAQVDLHRAAIGDERATL